MRNTIKPMPMTATIAFHCLLSKRCFLPPFYYFSCSIFSSSDFSSSLSCSSMVSPLSLSSKGFQYLIYLRRHHHLLLRALFPWAFPPSSSAYHLQSSRRLFPTLQEQASSCCGSFVTSSWVPLRALAIDKQKNLTLKLPHDLLHFLLLGVKLRPLLHPPELGLSGHSLHSGRL